MDNEKAEKRLFKKESKVGGTQANIKEGENTNQKTLCSKSEHTFGLSFLGLGLKSLVQLKMIYCLITMLIV